MNPKQQNLHTTVKSLSLIESPPSKPTASQPDLDTYSSLLHACISQKSLHHGQRLYLHLLLPRNRHLLNNPILKTKLITLYAVCGQIDEARRIFYDGIRENRIPESVWVAMAIGYSRNGCFQEALNSGVNVNGNLHWIVLPNLVQIYNVNGVIVGYDLAEDRIEEAAVAGFLRSA
ncbi:hypothetical protein RJ639_025162 [Escallonia herrerae]|uniref:Uncharacterized protein n=1 Tax=Escallonia herrerae TaxID=1293975 RepID=A0AA88UYP5_9ASTE|nr:hypothetical protein RJ639_025162 [Escallonia herrerae]